MLPACQQATVQQQTAALSLSTGAMASRQASTRRFDTPDEGKILSAAAAVMQDLGFTIEESNAKAGLLVGSKDRASLEYGFSSGQMFSSTMIAAAGGRSSQGAGNSQRIKLSIATRIAPDKRNTIVRVSFQRLVLGAYTGTSTPETIDSPEIYQQFFDRLSQSVFLEAHEL